MIRVKKPKRKRRRNKSKNFYLRKMRPKKFHYQNAVKSDISNFEFKPEGKQIMSNWYWSNYMKAVQWQEKHQLAHWKACALALLEENRYLLQIINQLHPGMHPEVLLAHKHLNEVFYSRNNYQFPSTSKEVGNIYNNVMDYRQTQGGNNNVNEEDQQQKKEKNDDDGNDEDDDENNDDYNDDDNDDDNDEDNDDDNDDDDDNKNDEIEFEMSEEMVEFFKQSYKHKMELKKLKEKESINKAENEIQQLHNSRNKRSSEMKFLYGDGASMITGMETAVQLSFEKYCDTKAPKYWPNIPFRL